MDFALIPEGEFDMGSPESENAGPVHRVNVSKPFYMGKYEVTQKQWHDVMGNNPSQFKGDDLPVEQVSWNDVQDFIKKLNDKEGTDRYRLPSEAEWEYAARARTNTTYSFGNNKSELGDYAWYDGNSGSKTHEVGQKKPNPWGLYDMHGNVWEWVQDNWHDDYYGAPTDGSFWERGAGSNRVFRGGSWFDRFGYFRSAIRASNAAGARNDGTGFRLVMEITTNVSLPTNITPSVPSIPIITPSSNQEIFTNSIGMEFVQIPSGEFDMGSPVVVHYNERPIHHVIISKPFYMGKYEVTQKQWMDIMGNNPSYFKGDNLPIEQVSWYDVQEYIKKLNEKEGTDRYRLPSEAEWEYAARAGTNTTYSFGNNKSELGDYAWYDGNSGGKTHEVGQKKPNPWGLYDMHGNVWEWVQDTFSKNGTYDGAPTNGSAWESGNNTAWESRDNSTIQDYYYMKVARGAGADWDWDPRSAVRDWQAPQKRLKDLGFRLVMDL
ncbi:MAG: formylglycine-generating enzyme family protein [Candidatus Methanoperedens sp.]|nr:formylglycine-generating enzyme family protein [Candidatus Methanoperedens sp.]